MLHRLTVTSPAFRAAAIGTGIMGILSASFGFWTVPLAIRTYGVSPHDAGSILAIATAGGSFAGTLVGGALADWWRERSPAAALWIGVMTLVVGGIALATLLVMPNLTSYCAVLAILMATCGIWPAPLASLVQDMILPHMRGRAAVMFSLTIMLMSLSLGPYTVGRIADATGSLGKGLGALFLLAPISIALLMYAVRKLPEAFAERERAMNELNAEHARGG